MKCEEIIRSPKTGLRRACPGHIDAKDICSHRQYHMWGFKSGWCGTGACEGTKPTVDGVPQMTCRKWQKCPCDCHDMMSKILAPKKQNRTHVPDEYVPRVPTIKGFLAGWEQKQKLFKNPPLRVEALCKQWLDTDRKIPCTAHFLSSQTVEEKPLSDAEIEKILRLWGQDKKAFVGGEPLRFIQFIGG